MTTDFGFVDTKEQAFAPLPLSTRHKQQLIKTITQIMVAFGARPSELLSIYSPAVVMWEIPTLFCGRLVDTALTVSCAERRDVGEAVIYQCYKDIVAVVKKKGFGEEAETIVGNFFGRGALHPMVFTRTEKSLGAAALFGLEWACLLHHIAEQSTFQDNHAFVRLSTAFLTPPMGVVSGQCEGGFKVEAGFLEECMTMPRGYISFPTFDSLDRANIWVMQNFALLEEPEKLLRGLCLLKMMQNPRVAYSFEQALHNLASPPVVEPSLRSLIYTDDALNRIRDIWYDYKAENMDKLNLLHLQLVPMYLDDMQFREIFKHMPADSERFTFKMEQDINKGLEKFVALFLQTRRAIAGGKRIVME